MELFQKLCVTTQEQTSRQDDVIKSDIATIRNMKKERQQKYVDALIKFHYRRVERNKTKLTRIKDIKQQESRNNNDVKQPRDKAHSTVSGPNVDHRTC